MVNDADGLIYVKLTVKTANYAVNRQSLVTVTPLFTIVIYGAIFEWRRMCTTLFKILPYIRPADRHLSILFKAVKTTLSKLRHHNYFIETTSS